MASQLRLTDQRRQDALKQLKAAQTKLAKGREALTKAQAEIDEAQSLIDKSAEVLRRTYLRKLK